MNSKIRFDRLLAVPSVQHAIRAEKLLQAAGIAVEMIPTPREISLSCGQCLLFASACQEECQRLLAAGNIFWTALYQRERRPLPAAGWKYEKLEERLEDEL